ncbi:DUF2267 domain-containing protein [Actinomadura kijaniata]|uniref:Uncharacterized protein (DUF2267 family) n=1 Tax=Actinomadura namibiensis TaxID=182080 RepID=A0A7W3QM77_ACTNM|nr:DUF2267 domain-containing protein [Actinomadura namibiensis]MBA8952285.1 uncharacterized protein (DUF2267 family) [Actinomadura namibiensis]
MHDHEFLARVRERGGYADQDEARRVTVAVLQVLAERVTAGEARDLAAELPGSLAGALAPGRGSADRFGVEEFCRRVSGRVGGGSRAAGRDAGAVLSTVADAVPPGELDHLTGRLPAGYAALFGRAGLGA